VLNEAISQDRWHDRRVRTVPRQHDIRELTTGNPFIGGTHQMGSVTRWWLEGAVGAWGGGKSWIGGADIDGPAAVSALKGLDGGWFRGATANARQAASVCGVRSGGQILLRWPSVAFRRGGRRGFGPQTVGMSTGGSEPSDAHSMFFCILASGPRMKNRDGSSVAGFPGSNSPGASRPFAQSGHLGVPFTITAV